MKLSRIKLPYKITTGSALPKLKSNEHDVEISFLTFDNNNRLKIEFNKFYQYKFGYPNGEGLSEHKLYKLGLEPYSFYEVIDLN